jgi:quercetin dioxygenase-like cupin family protein
MNKHRTSTRRTDGDAGVSVGRKVSFYTRLGITASGLYAQTMAERGFIAIAHDRPRSERRDWRLTGRRARRPLRSDEPDSLGDVHVVLRAVSRHEGGLMTNQPDEAAHANTLTWRAGASRRSVLLAAAAIVALPLTRAWGARNGGEGMEITRSGSQPSVKGPADWFTGAVRIDPLFDAPAPARGGGASVTFEPGARTAWHTHPLGQTLIVTAGAGRAQRWGGPIEELRPGDVVWFAPGEKHWHGAGPTTGMTHIAVQEKLDGKAVDWLEHVTAEQYGMR